MKFKFVPMNLEYAQEMIQNWKYDGEYHIYDYKNEEEFLLEKETWGLGKFAVLNEEDKLIGELNIEFFKEGEEDSEDEGYVEHEVVKNNPQNIYEMWMGWGLNPKLCGKGHGKKFVSQCIDFAVKEYDYKGEFVRCGVAAFNERAIKVYERVGFETFHIHEGEIANEKFKIYHMRKKLI
ncbi:GNAT family N-acetyltransferase [Oceanirhabdus seepicola]|uniref:GNAT family N-acetyltransferase n=1 Tax=Oceanirhabdus seepicola TaxID=2828781 RepID=A0A9J6NY78_9CLOT|nr:GNAT family N-acetyltransferase [Oceanirhabdus seepicola]MCM1989004.1 GNAT family N-acetyltransferase [Oceanirhabdus seepicola]